MATTEYELADNGTETDTPALRVEDFDRQPTTSAHLTVTRARLDAYLAGGTAKGAPI